LKEYFNAATQGPSKLLNFDEYTKLDAKVEKENQLLDLKKKYMKIFNPNCLSCVSKNEGIQYVKENKELWSPENIDDQYIFHVFCSKDLEQKCCQA